MQFSILREQHRRRKKLLQNEAGLTTANRRLLLGIDLRLLEAGELFLVADLVKGLRVVPVDAVFITGSTTANHEKILKSIAPGTQFFPENAASRIYTGSDAMLFTNKEPKTLAHIQEAMESGTIPITLENMPNLLDYDPIKEEGNAFLFFPKDPWAAFFALTRVLENFRFPYDWESLMRNAALKPWKEDEADEETAEAMTALPHE